VCVCVASSLGIGRHGFSLRASSARWENRIILLFSNVLFSARLLFSE